MPKIQLLKEKADNTIEIESGSTGGGSSAEPGSGSGGSNAKEYLLNDGTLCVFKKGKKYLELEPENMKKLNLLLNNNQEGTLKVENVTDDLYDNSNIVLNVTDKKLSFNPKFKNGKPIYDIKIDITVMVEEVDEENPNKNYLKRNKEFLTKKLVDKIQETIISDSIEIIEYCKEQEIDLIGVYENFYRKKYKEFKKYYDETQEKYLNDVDYNISVKVSSSY
jgi:hypothetical protein